MYLGIKKLIKSKLHPLVWERLGQAKQEFYWTKKEFHCDLELIPVFKKYLTKSDGYYVDIGANDGRSVSNTYHLEKYQGWKAVLIEPIMHISFRSRQLRSIDSNKFYNCACVSDKYVGDNIRLLYSGLMSVTVSDTQDYDPESWAIAGVPFLARGEHVQETWSKARTLESILRESNSPSRIDLLSIDTEGAEFNVLQGVLFENWVFEYILIETIVNSNAFALLEANGYIHIESISQNLLFCHPEVLA